MRNTVTALAIAFSLGAIVLAAPDRAQARFGAEVIANAVTTHPLAEPVQYRRTTTRTQRPARSTRAAPPPRMETTAPYIYPGSRGALLNCSFC